MTYPTQGPSAFPPSHPLHHVQYDTAIGTHPQDRMAPSTPGIDATPPSFSWDRPSLRSAEPQNPPDVLVSLAAAFAAIFSAESDSAKSSFSQISQNQTLANIQSQEVMTSAVLAVQKQEQVYNLYEKAEREQNNPFLKCLNWITLGLSIVLILATFISGFFDGGSSEALLPEEIEMTDMAATTVAEGSEGMSEAPVITGDLEGATELQNLSGSGQASETSASSATTTTQAERSALSKFLIYGGRMLGAAAGSSSMLAQGIVSFKLASVFRELAATQRTTGATMGTQSMQQSVFSFLEKCSQRDQTTASNEASGGADVTKTYDEIIALYSQIATQSKQGLI